MIFKKFREKGKSIIQRDDDEINGQGKNRGY